MNEHKFGVFGVFEGITHKAEDEFEARLLRAHTPTQIVASIYPRVKALVEKHFDTVQQNPDSFKLEKQELLQYLCVVVLNRGGKLFTDMLGRNPFVLDKAREYVKDKLSEAIDVCVTLAGIDCASDEVNIEAMITHYREVFPE